MSQNLNNSRKITCPICGKYFDSRGFNNHVDKYSRDSDSNKNAKARTPTRYKQ